LFPYRLFLSKSRNYNSNVIIELGWKFDAKEVQKALDPFL